MARGAPPKLTAVVAGQYGDVWRRRSAPEGANEWSRSRCGSGAS